MNIEEFNAKLSGDLTGYSLVFGEGRNDSKVVFIGEAPGKNEVEQGKCFVGSAGKNLESFLKELALKRDNIYITNAVKFRPTKKGKAGDVNRPPTRKEIELFKPYLLEEISLIKPELIVTLGAVPLSVFIPQPFKMADYAGKPFDGFCVEIFPLYHPASIIYNRALKVEYDRHIGILKNIIDNIIK